MIPSSETDVNRVQKLNLEWSKSRSNLSYLAQSSFLVFKNEQIAFEIEIDNLTKFITLRHYNNGLISKSEY